MKVSLPTVFKSSSTSSVPSSPWSSSFPCFFHSGCHNFLAFFHYSSFQYVHTIFKQFHKFFQESHSCEKKNLTYKKKKSQATGIKRVLIIVTHNCKDRNTVQLSQIHVLNQLCIGIQSSHNLEQTFEVFVKISNSVYVKIFELTTQVKQLTYYII